MVSKYLGSWNCLVCGFVTSLFSRQYERKSVPPRFIRHRPPSLCSALACLSSHPASLVGPFILLSLRMDVAAGQLRVWVPDTTLRNVGPPIWRHHRPHLSEPLSCTRRSPVILEKLLWFSDSHLESDCDQAPSNTSLYFSKLTIWNLISELLKINSSVK